MIATIGFILEIGLLVYMIIRGIDMITATVVTAAVILVTSGLNVWDGFLTTYSGGIGSFVTSWFLILGLGGVFGQLVLEAGLATRIAKTLTEKLGAKMVGAVILICSFFITLLGINGYIMVFVLYPIADNLLKQNKMDRRVLPFLILGGGACANGFAFSLDVCNVLPSNYLDTSLGSSPVLSFLFTAIAAISYFVYFNYAQKQSRKKHSVEELLAMYPENEKEEDEMELPGFGISVLPFLVVLGAVVVTSSWGTSTSILFSLAVGILLIVLTQLKRIKNIKASIKSGSTSGLNLQAVVLNLNMPMYLKAFFGTTVLTGLTGSAISGETIFMESFAQAFVDMDINVQALHRIVTEAALVLNKLPNSSVAILTMSICGCRFKDSYKHVLLGTTLPCFIAGLLVAVLATMGFVF